MVEMQPPIWQLSWAGAWAGYGFKEAEARAVVLQGRSEGGCPACLCFTVASWQCQEGWPEQQRWWEKKVLGQRMPLNNFRGGCNGQRPTAVKPWPKLEQ
jgi:hypothetical protein